MQKEELAPLIWQTARKILLTDFILAAILGLVCFVFALRTLGAYSTILSWAGEGILIFACFTAVGGFASRVQDAAAYTMTRAGDMYDNLRQISNARSSNLGCLLQILLLGFGLIGLSYIVQYISALLNFA
jgi:hypothetical protein